MDWKKFAVVTAAVLVAGYVGARLSNDGSDAMAGSASGGLGSKKVIALSTDASGNEANRLILVNPTKRKILVYKLSNNEMGLVVVRGYEYDQALPSTRQNQVGGNGWGYQASKNEYTKAAVANQAAFTAQQTLVDKDVLALTTNAQGNEGNRLVLVSPELQKVMVYKMNGNDMNLVTVRGYEFDQEVPFSLPGGIPGNGADYDSIKKTVDEATKAAGAGGNQ